MGAKALPNGWHELLERFDGARAGIAFAIAQLGQERDVTAKAVQRQVAVLAVVAVKIGPLLVAVQGIVGGVKIQHNLGALARDGFDAPLEQQRFDFVGLGLDLAVAAVEPLGAQLQAVKRGVAGQRLALIARRRALLAERIGFTANEGLQRVTPQVVMIIDVFVAQS